MSERTIDLTVNGERHRTVTRDHVTLLEVLRVNLGLTGTKHGCELGECGACTVLVDDRPMLSCLALAVSMEGREITTVEGLAANGRAHPLQETFTELGAAQCGYCTPGMLMSAKALLDSGPERTIPEIRQALAGNACRCTGYQKILDAVQLAGKRISETRK